MWSQNFRLIVQRKAWSTRRKRYYKPPQLYLLICGVGLLLSLRALIFPIQLWMFWDETGYRNEKTTGYPFLSAKRWSGTAEPAVNVRKNFNRMKKLIFILVFYLVNNTECFWGAWNHRADSFIYSKQMRSLGCQGCPTHETFFITVVLVKSNENMARKMIDGIRDYNWRMMDASVFRICYTIFANLH